MPKNLYAVHTFAILQHHRSRALRMVHFFSALSTIGNTLTHFFLFLKARSVGNDRRTLSSVFAFHSTPLLNISYLVVWSGLVWPIYIRFFPFKICNTPSSWDFESTHVSLLLHGKEILKFCYIMISLWGSRDRQRVELLTGLKREIGTSNCVNTHWCSTVRVFDLTTHSALLLLDRQGSSCEKEKEKLTINHH